MTSRPRFWLSVSLLAPILSIAIVIPALAFEYPLSSTSIREAYFLGKRNDSGTADLLMKYAQQPPMPESGPHIAVVTVDTPYTQVVERAKRLPNYDAQTAEQDFLGKLAVFRLHVQIDLTASYGPLLSTKGGAARLRSEDFWKEFKFRVIQDKEIPCRKIEGVRYTHWETLAPVPS